MSERAQVPLAEMSLAQIATFAAKRHVAEVVRKALADSHRHGEWQTRQAVEKALMEVVG